MVKLCFSHFSLLLLQCSLHFSSSTECPTPNFPNTSVVNHWRYQGARELCFCAYSQLDTTPVSPSQMQQLALACPDWNKYVSTDNVTANKVHSFGTSTVLGSKQPNVTLSRYGNILDWSVDVGSGFNQECNTTMTPLCKSQGSHILSIPNSHYFNDCCTLDNVTSSLAATLPSKPKRICTLLADMIRGALANVQNLEQYTSCNVENMDPTAANQCLAQCFHYRPDVNWVHLHTTAGVLSMRDGPIDSGLGPGFNLTEERVASAGYGRYNVCVCEPNKWSAGSKRGNCPVALPFEKEYVEQATMALCRNMAGASGVDGGLCEHCAAALV